MAGQAAGPPVPPGPAQRPFAAGHNARHQSLCPAHPSAPSHCPNVPHCVPVIHTLPNGLALLCLQAPQAPTTAVSLYVRAGSAHEPTRLAGIGHVLEHMVFKGSATRSCRQINVDAERLGAEVNAHTDRDHTAFHMRGLAEHAGEFIRMLADIVLGAQFPDDELQRERAVVLQEFAEDEDDSVSAAFRLVDAASFGSHPVGRPIIGTRRGIEAITREDLAQFRGRLYTGTNMVLAVAGPMSPDALRRVAEPLFGALPAGAPNRLPPAVYEGGLRSKGMDGSSQSHAVIAYPLPPRTADDIGGAVAAALLGEGMSSPLLDTLREQRGLVYYAACSADVNEFSGQFVVEASTSPAQLAEALQLTGALLAQQAQAITPLDLERTRNQLRVRWLRLLERPARHLEAAVLDWLALGRVRALADDLARLDALDATALRGVFQQVLAPGATLAVTGKVPRGFRHAAPGWYGLPLAGG